MARIHTNRQQLRRWLNARKSALERHRSPHESKWRQIREVYCPTLGHGLDGDTDMNQASARRDDDKIFNSTPRILLSKLAAGLQSGITNQARQWFVFRAKDKKAAKQVSVRTYCGKITDILHARMNASNIYTALDQIYLRLGAFGQSAALLVPDDEAVLRLIVADEGAYWLDEDRRGRVDTMLRRMRMPLRQLREEFGSENLPHDILDALERGNLEDDRTVYNLVCPMADLPHGLDVRDIPAGREVASFYWLDASSDGTFGILAIRSYDYNPVIAPRWMVNGLTVYGCGPGEIGLGDAKELQEIELASLRLTELESNPPMAAPADLKGFPIDTGPGGVTYYNPSPSGGSFVPVQRLFETRQSIEAVETKSGAVTARLNQIFYTDLFAMLLNLETRKTPRTATEVQELSSEKVSLLGPVLTRLNNDLLKPLVEAAWHIVYTRAAEEAEDAGDDPLGILDTPPALLNGAQTDENGEADVLEIEYTSTLHAEQLATSRLSGPFRFVEFYGGVQNVLQQQELADNIDGDKMLRAAAEILDSAGYIRDERDVEKIRQGRAEAAEARERTALEAQAAQAQAQNAQSVKDLAEARLTDGESALDIIAGAQGVAA